MKNCYNCNHCEVCRWIDEFKDKGVCDFYENGTPPDDKCHYCEHNFTPYKGNTGEFEPQNDEDVLVQYEQGGMKDMIPKGVIEDIKADIQKEENILYHDCEPDFSKDFDVIRVDTVLEIIDKHISREEKKSNENV